MFTKVCLAIYHLLEWVHRLQLVWTMFIQIVPI
nr:MAG TPA: hypothetical protein [Caudoviricetes sp.]